MSDRLRPVDAVSSLDKGVVGEAPQRNIERMMALPVAQLTDGERDVLAWWLGTEQGRAWCDTGRFPWEATDG